MKLGVKTFFSEEFLDAFADKADFFEIMAVEKNDYDFLKIDIEGAETVVIEDCADLLINVNNLFVEYHSFDGKEQKLDILLSILKKSGFRYYIYNFGNLSHHPFEEKKTYLGMDMQLNIYACRF